MAIGDIIGEIASLDFDTAGGVLPKIIHVSGTTYAIAYQGSGNDGYLRTVSISDDGATLAVISVLEFDTTNGAAPWIIHIAGTVYAIAYVGPGANGTLKTFNISDDGTSITLIQTFVYESGATIIEPVIVHISGTTYAIFYGGPDNDGWIKTVTIQDDGTITGEIASLEFDATFGLYSDPIHISGDVWAIAYTTTGPNGPGRIKTFTITSAGAISAIASYDYDTNQTSAPDIFHISGNVYAIAYGGPGFDGWLKITVIDNDGTLGGTIIDSLEFDPTYCSNPWVIPISSNVWCIAYTGPDTDGWLRTIKIEDNGIITGEPSYFEYDEATGRYTSMLHISGDVYAIAYLGPGNDGWLKTVEIVTAALLPESAVGYIWEEDTKTHIVVEDRFEKSFEGSLVAAGSNPEGQIFTEDSYFHAIDEEGDERRTEGAVTGDTGPKGTLFTETARLHIIDENSDERYI